MSPGASLDPEAETFAVAAQRASLALACLLSAVMVVCLGLASLLPLALAGPFGLACVVLRLGRFGSARSLLPNLITALRVLLISLMGWFGPQGNAHWQAALVALVFTLDGADGSLARKLRACSRLGAHFDMESDGYLVLMLCTLLWLRGCPPWVLSAGLLRYAYVFVTQLVPSRGEAPPSRFGRYAFSVALTCLTAALLLDAPFGSLVAGVGTALLAWSFGRSFYWALHPGRTRSEREQLGE
jgi:phosphatidylglycerophosphate synthase